MTTIKLCVLIYLFLGIILMYLNVYLLVNKNDGWFDPKDKTLNYNEMSPIRQFVVQGLMILFWGPFVFINIIKFLGLFTQLIIVYIKHIYYNIALWILKKWSKKNTNKILDELLDQMDINEIAKVYTKEKNNEN